MSISFCASANRVGFLNNPKNEVATRPSLLMKSDSVSFCGAVKQSDNTITERVSRVQSEMKKEKLDALLVASTDDYLTEYVEPSQSQRQYISGFTGSDGDAVITHGKSHIIVDSRYFIQADGQVNQDVFKIQKLGLDENGNKKPESWNDRKIKIFKELTASNPEKTHRVGYDAAKISVDDLSDLQKKIGENNLKIELVPTRGNLVDRAWTDKAKEKIAPVREVPIALAGETPLGKLSAARAMLKSSNINMLAATDLGDIAYMTNLRGEDIQDNATFKSKMLITEDRAVVFCAPQKIPESVQKNLQGVVEFLPEDKFLETVKSVAKRAKTPVKLAVSSETTTQATYNDLKAAIGSRDEIVELKSNPIQQMRAIKNPAEMAAYKNSVRRTDVAVTQVMDWLNKGIEKGKTISEKDLEDKMKAAHLANGANALSFAVIPAAGTNSALVHYENGDPNKIIKKNDLVLVDTGAYYEAGLATDLTRTWIAGGASATPTDKQKEVYTTVVKGALNGLFAELPPGASGCDLDAIVRNPIKAKNEEYNYMHATGHGVGVLCHEHPPYVSPSKAVDANIPLTPGMVFSIEPGAYIKDWGGVRFENLVTVVPHPNPEKAQKGWHKIKCLSFAPVDHNLIDKSLLSERELKLLAIFDKKSQAITEKAKLHKI